MRPAGEIRAALREAFPPAGQGHATWRDALAVLAQRKLVDPAAPSECRLVRQTVKNMRAAGELRPGPPVRVQGSRRPMVAYARNWATDWGQGEQGQSLAQVVTAWR